MDTAPINLLILDVDGVLTDGRVIPTAGGDGPKRFHTQDGCAIKLWHRCGGRTVLLSGRTGEAVRDRAVELGVEQVHLGVPDKLKAYERIVSSASASHAHVAYVGDDLPDLAPMERCGFPVAVANAVPAVKRVCAYITRREGGRGAVAEVIELLLRKRNQWSRTLLTEGQEGQA